MITCLPKAQIDHLKPHLGENLYRHLTSGQLNKFESYPECNLVVIHYMDITQSKLTTDCLMICQLKDEIYIICEDEAAVRRFQNDVLKSDVSSGVLPLFWRELIRRDLDYLEDLEEEIADLETRLLHSVKKDYPEEIIEYRKRLLRLKRYYEDLDLVMDGYLENANGLLSEDDLTHFKRLHQRTERLMRQVFHLQDYITQVREAYQAQMDIAQNNIMKIFTIVTTLFLPMTLIAGWYGMNLNMPEFGWKYGYQFVIGLSIVVVTVLLLFFKRKKWF